MCFGPSRKEAPTTEAFDMDVIAEAVRTFEASQPLPTWKAPAPAEFFTQVIKRWEGDMIRAVTPELATEIAMKGYFYVPKFDLLTWCPATAAIIDWGYMSGPGTASLALQRIVGATLDGVVGPQTAAAYKEWVEANGWRATCQDIRTTREAFFRSLNRPEYIQGWLNRAAWASPENPEFWSQWAS
jgi:lysozyme family protein